MSEANTVERHPELAAQDITEQLLKARLAQLNAELEQLEALLRERLQDALEVQLELDVIEADRAGAFSLLL